MKKWVLAAVVAVSTTTLSGYNFEKIASDPKQSSELFLSTSFQEGLQSKANEIVALFQDGFQWEDIVIMIDSSRQYLKTHYTLNLNEEREAIKLIIADVISVTDTPLLPDLFTDSLFTYVSNTIIDAVYPRREFAFKKSFKKMDKGIAVKRAEELVNEYEGRFNWKDLGDLLAYAIAAADSFPKASFEEKCNFSKIILNYVIDETDTVNLPDLFVDWIFRKIGTCVIDTHFASQFN